MEPEEHRIGMAQAADLSSSLHTPTEENNLQPFFVLHRASAPRKTAAKTRRRIDLSPKSSSTSAEEHNDNSRMETFNSLWSNADSVIKEVLRNINSNVYGEIDKWVRASFDAIRAHHKLDFSRATSPYPILDSSSIAVAGSSRQISTALLFTKNMEFVDDILTFADLSAHLSSRGCHVANLTSLDLSTKNGVGGCLKTLLRQFLMDSIDAPDMSVLAAWFAEKENSENPLVVIIDDIERCCASVLIDFIFMIREWVVKIPIILILGVATTVDVLCNILSYDVWSHLYICEFTLGSPAQRMDSVIEAVLLKNCGSLRFGKQVSAFLRNYFIRHDGTLTLFVRALKIAVVQHIYSEPLSHTLSKLVRGEGTEGFDDETVLLGDTVFKQASGLPSLQRCSQPINSCIDWASGIYELKRLHRLWSSVVMCLYEAGKYRRITLLDLYCEMLKVKPDSFSGSDLRSVVWVFQIVRDLPMVELSKLLSRWENLTRGIKEIHGRIKELQSLMASDENSPKCHLTEASKRPAARRHINQKRDETTVNEKAAALLQHMVRQYIQPTETIPFNEVVFFNDVDRLQSALIGDPRRRIQADLLESSKFLKCSCCNKNAGVLVPSLHHTSILYSLAQEHGDLINLHEWFHSFKALISQAPSKAVKKRPKASPSPKKLKNSNAHQKRSDASVQAEFCKAVMELQITGLIRMPTKRRPDYVQRTAFGL